MPHNLVMIRAPPFSRSQQQPLQNTSADAQETTVGDQDTVIRSILVPRKPAYGSYNFVALMS